MNALNGPSEASSSGGVGGLPLVFAVVAACSSAPKDIPTPEAGPPVAEAPSAGCQVELVDHIWTESAHVDVAGGSVFWHEYNFGRILRRPVTGGPVTKLVGFDREHHSEDFAATESHVYWTSKATATLYRVPTNGGPPETLVTAKDDYPIMLAVAGSTIYATTDSGLLWWRDGKSGAKPFPGVRRIAAFAETLYIGGEDQILWIREAGGVIERLAQVSGDVVAIAAAADGAWFVAEADGRSWLYKISPGTFEVDEVLAWVGGEFVSLAVSDAGVLVAFGNLVHRVAGDKLVTIAKAPANVTSIVGHGDSIYVGTSEGSVHSLCAGAVELADRMPELECPAGFVLRKRPNRHWCVDTQRRATGPSAETYLSGDIKETVAIAGDRRTSKQYYADGTQLSVTTTEPGKEIWHQYWANGNLAWKSETIAGVETPTEYFKLDGSAKKKAGN